MYLSAINGYPLQDSETPIQKIVIRPLLRFRPISVSDGNGVTKIKVHKRQKSPNIDLGDSPSSVITVIHKAPKKTLPKVHKLKFRIQPGRHPVYYARARVNGSFKDHPIRSFEYK